MKKIRNEIDQIDDAIIALLLKRLEWVALLKNMKSTLRDTNREKEILSKIPSKYVRSVYRSIFKSSSQMLNDIGFTEKSS